MGDAHCALKEHSPVVEMGTEISRIRPYSQSSESGVQWMLWDSQGAGSPEELVLERTLEREI